MCRLRRRGATLPATGYDRRVRTNLQAGTSLLAFALLAGCEAPAPRPAESFNARSDIHESLQLDLATPRHESDGGGSATLVAGPGAVSAGDAASWTFVYEAGPLGIVEGGWLYFQVSPFWNWSSPQTLSEFAPGYTTVETTAEGVELEATTIDRQLLAVRIGGRPLAPGELIELTFGAGASGAVADSYAERESPFWFAVDGDGDGVRGLVVPSPTVEVVAGPASGLVVTLPSVVRPGEVVELRAAAVDPIGNRARVPLAEVALLWHQLDSDEPGADRSAPESFPDALEIGPDGVATLSLSAPESGIWRVRAVPVEPLTGAVSNPMMVSPDAERVLWGDVHGHSNLSDGTGTPEQYFEYARDVAALDFTALTDHDHWGLQPLATHPELWQRIRTAVERFHAPGRFSTLLGYEWTNWVHGHRHVLYFSADGPVLSAVDPDYETPPKLWAALRGLDAMTFAHHSAGAPVATNWSYPPDPELEPVTEVVSVHGSSEAADSPRPVRGAAPGHFVRDVLDRGFEFGFIGSGDSHDGHPGLTQLANPGGGLAALVGAENSRAGLAAALRARHCYATSGARIVVEASIEGRLMGSRLPVADRVTLEAGVVGTAPIERIDLVRSGEIVLSRPGDGSPLARLTTEIQELKAGEYLYLRVVQVDGHAAWTSPFYFGEGAGESRR